MTVYKIEFYNSKGFYTKEKTITEKNYIMLLNRLKKSKNVDALSVEQFTRLIDYYSQKKEYITQHDFEIKNGAIIRVIQTIQEY